jgi:hypothetical protein
VVRRDANRLAYSADPGRPATGSTGVLQRRPGITVDQLPGGDEVGTNELGRRLGQAQ